MPADEQLLFAFASQTQGSTDIFQVLATPICLIKNNIEQDESNSGDTNNNLITLSDHLQVTHSRRW